MIFRTVTVKTSNKNTKLNHIFNGGAKTLLYLCSDNLKVLDKAKRCCFDMFRAWLGRLIFVKKSYNCFFQKMWSFAISCQKRVEKRKATRNKIAINRLTFTVKILFRQGAPIEKPFCKNCKNFFYKI